MMSSAFIHISKDTVSKYENSKFQVEKTDRKNLFTLTQNLINMQKMFVIKGAKK